MATRFYLPITGAADISITPSASWASAASAWIGSQMKCVTTRISSALTSYANVGTLSDDQHYYFGIWVSDRLQPQTIAQQTLTLAVRNNETNTGNNLQLHFIVRLVAADGTTFLDLVSFTDEGSERGTTAGVSFWTGNTTARTAVGGDRIVIEMGLGGNPTSTNVHSGAMTFGDNNANDNVGTDGDTNNYNPWVNFGTTTLAFMRRRVFLTHR